MKPVPWDAVIFDYGRVLSTSPSRHELAALATLTGVPEASFFELYSNTRDSYDRGEADCNQHWQRFAEVAEVEIPSDTVERIVTIESLIWTKVNPETLALVRDVKALGLKTAILSNMPFDLLGELRRKLDWLGEFDVLTWSCELGIIKPDAEIYRACLAELDCEPARTIFFDDRPANVEGAKLVGMNAHVFESASQARAILQCGIDLR